MKKENAWGSGCDEVSRVNRKYGRNCLAIVGSGVNRVVLRSCSDVVARSHLIHFFFSSCSCREICLFAENNDVT